MKVLDNVSFIINRDDKVAFVGSDELAKTTLFKILVGEIEPDSGSYNGELPQPRHIFLKIIPKTLTVKIQLLTGLCSFHLKRM